MVPLCSCVGRAQPLLLASFTWHSRAAATMAKLEAATIWSSDFCTTQARQLKGCMPNRIFIKIHIGPGKAPGEVSRTLKIDTSSSKELFISAWQAAQHSTAQHSTAQHSTAQHSTAQHLQSVSQAFQLVSHSHTRSITCISVVIERPFHFPGAVAV